MLSMNFRVVFLFLFLSVVWASCERDIQILETNAVDSELQSYVERFEAEAAARGISMDISALGISVELISIEEQNVAGVCYYSANHPGQIEIDLEIWNQIGGLGREFVIFHELGHCAINRDHTEAQFSNGICRSIMASGTGTCRDNYTSQTRTTYINELFSRL